MTKEVTMNDLHKVILKIDAKVDSIDHRLENLEVKVDNIEHRLQAVEAKVDKMEKALTALVKDVAATNKILIAHQFDNIAIKNMYMREEHPDWLRGNRLMDRSGKQYKKTPPKKR